MSTSPMKTPSLKTFISCLAHTVLSTKTGELEVERYYRIQYRIEEDKPLEYWEDAIAKEFTESVAMHQISDVEVGCFLSSGSGLQLCGQGKSLKGTKKVKTFSVGYEEEKVQ